MKDKGRKRTVEVIPHLLSLIHSTPVLVEQSGVLACPSRKRSRVQIPPGTLEGDCPNFRVSENRDCPL